MRTHTVADGEDHVEVVILYGAFDCADAFEMFRVQSYEIYLVLSIAILIKQ